MRGLWALCALSLFCCRLASLEDLSSFFSPDLPGCDRNLHVVLLYYVGVSGVA